MGAPIEHVGEGPTPAAIADFFFKQPGGHNAHLARGPRRYDNLRRAVARVVSWREKPAR